MSNVLLQAEKLIDRTARIMPGAFVEDGVTIASGVLVGHNAVVMGRDQHGISPAAVDSGAEIGANATILPGVRIGSRARVAPGSVVMRSVPPLAIVEGNPARIIGYITTTHPHTRAWVPPQPNELGTVETHVAGVTLHHLKCVSDLRGNLSAGEFERDVPFAVKRYFLVFDVPTAETRGEHAHIRCKQFLVAIKGSVNVVADDGKARGEFILDRPDLGLFLPPMTWGIQYRYSADAMLIVFASEYYDAEDYIRHYETFLLRCNRPREI